MPNTTRWLALGLLLWATLGETLWAQIPTDRLSDNLLARPDLQQIVDLQVGRDVSALIDRLVDPDPVVRARTALALASVQDSAAVPALLDRLDDAAATVRADAAFALGQSDGQIPAVALLHALSEASREEVQRRLLEALGKKGDQASLVTIVSRSWPDTLHYDLALSVARYAIRGIHAPEAVDYLIGSLQSENPLRRHHAAYYFARSRETELWAPVALAVRAVLDSLEVDDGTAMFLLTGLGRLQEREDTPRLLHWLRTAEDWRIRVNAARALAQRTDEQGIRAALYDHLVDPSVHVAVAAAQALNDGKAWSASDADLIQQWVQYNGYAWRITSPLLQGLARQGSTEFVLNELDRRRGRPPLLAYAKGLPALEHVPYGDAFDYLVNAAHSQNVRVAYAALTTLASRWPEDRAKRSVHSAYLDVFAYGLRRKDLTTVSATARVLSDSLFRDLGGTQILQEVYQMLDTPADLASKILILRALGASEDPNVETFLRHELTYLHPTIITAAGQALEELTGTSTILPSGVEPSERTINWDYLKELGPHPQLVVETAKGTIILVLDTEQAPLTIQTLSQFARAGNFNDVPFHRVVPNFVVQGGDYARKDGFGSPPFSIRSEFTRIPYRAGVVGMASSGKDTEGSQFFITHSMQPHLDGGYTAFGFVQEGQDIVAILYEDDHIVRATIFPDTQ